MLISEFIKTLEEYQDEYGEVQVFIHEHRNDYDFDCFPGYIDDPFDGCLKNVILLEM